MHSYMKLKDRWSVGYWPDPQPQPWIDVRSFDYEGEAAAYCCYLNGGEPPIRLLARLGLTSWEAEYKK